MFFRFFNKKNWGREMGGRGWGLGKRMGKKVVGGVRGDRDWSRGGVGEWWGG